MSLTSWNTNSPTGREGLERYAAAALPVTDDRPRIEYAPWTRTDEITRVLPDLLAYATEPPLLDPNATLSTNITAERKNLTTFYAAGIAAYTGDRQTWANQIRQALHQDPGNPYYRWAVGQP